MFKSILLSTTSLLLLATPIHAVCGIHTFGHCEDMITHWYDPQTGEICDPLDCGGGRAPPKTNVPGCGDIPLPPYTASYLSCWTPGFTGAPGPPATVVQQSTAETTAETVPEKTTAAEVPSASETTAVVEGPSTKETTAVAAPSSSTEESAKGSSTVASTEASSSPKTTAPAVLPSSAQTGASNGTVTSSSVTSAAPTADDTGAAVVVKGSVMAVLGAVAAVVVMV